MLTKHNHNSLKGPGNRMLWTVLLLAAVLCWTGAARAQLPMPPSTQFDITGFLQEATLDGVAGATAAHQGGHLKVNGQLVTVPAETIVIFPANALTWQEIFAKAPAPWGIPTNPGVTTLVATTGMAADDCANTTNPCTAPPLTTYEVHVIGNRVIGATDEYIAGLIYVSQQALNSGSGFINFIDYANAEMRVGGVIGDPLTGARVRINDPVVAGTTSGRYSAGLSPDQRFSVDQDNPTITAGTGYPMCLPRGSFAGDLLCPQGNRPISAAGTPTVYNPSFTMNNASNTAFPIVAGFPDSRLQAPFEVGDFITFAGTLVKDAPATGFAPGDGPTVGTWPILGTPSTYISAHTIEDNIAIYTFPGSNPAYVRTDVTLMGTGGLTALGVGEATIRTRFEGMTTDVVDPALAPGAPQRGIHLYGIDLDPATGATIDRTWGTIGVDPGPAGNGAVKGRWRFRPPCLPFGTIPTKPDKDCVMNAANTFLPPTREMRAVIEGSWIPGQTTAFANGIIYGQYHAPISEYIFPENVPGTPIVENNFNAMPFLACGGYSSSAGTLVGELNPWPSNVLPPLCAGAVPVAVPGANQTVASGTLVTLSGAASAGAAPLTFSWTAPAGITLSPNTTSAVVTFTAPIVTTPTNFTFSLVVTDTFGVPSAPATVTVTVSPATASDTVTFVLVEYRIAKQRLTVQATSSAGLAATLTLLPYIAIDGSTQPGGQLTVTGGIPTIIEVGVKQPAAGNSIVVHSSLGGTASSPITRLRQ